MRQGLADLGVDLDFLGQQVPLCVDRQVGTLQLIRALLEYATDTVSVTLEAETDGEEAEVLEVPFAELVIHRLEEEGIQMRQPMNQTLVQRFSAELDHERILTPEQLTQDQDHDVQQKVAGAMIN